MQAPASVGTTVSRYVVLEEIGRGGMGRVVRAYDPKLQREVALKDVHLTDEGGEDWAARLVAEARAMAQLSHPHVVAVFDVEALPSGKVVLVMEYVAGQTLKQWLGAEPRDWQAIVEQYSQAGRGLAAAHQAGLLHRDFKPANVLVALDGVVKVTDFGLAKAASSNPVGVSVELDPTTDGLTQTGTVLGTPRYMAPEQHHGEPLTAAADQYALCVALWEALCGGPPFSGPTGPSDKLDGPPPWPNRETPRPIVDAVTRGLSPQSGDRWPSVTALLAALQPAPRRGRSGWLVGAGVVGLVTAGGLSYRAWAQDRAQRCAGASLQLRGVWDDARRAQLRASFSEVDRPYAADAWTRTESALDEYGRQWTQAHTEACEATTVRGEQSSEMLDLRMGCLQRAALGLEAAVDTFADADAKLVQRAHEVAAGLPPLSRCSDVSALAAGVEAPPTGEADAVRAARLQLARAASLSAAGRYRRAQEAVTDAATALADVEYEPVRTQLALRRGFVAEGLGEYGAAETALEEALESGARHGQWDEVADAAVQLIFVVGEQQQRMQEALRYRPLAEGLTRRDPVSHARFRNNLANVFARQGKHAQAEAEHREVLAIEIDTLGAEHPHIAKSRNNLANALMSQGKFEEAEAEHRAALALHEKVLGPAHPYVSTSGYNLATALQYQGKFEEAEHACRAALNGFVAALGSEHPETARCRDNLGIILFQQKKYAEAEAEHREALHHMITALGPEHSDVATSRNALALALQFQGKYEQAEVEARAALDGFIKAMGPKHPSVASFRHNFADLLGKQGKHAEAEAEFQLALEQQTETLGADHPNVAMSRSSLAEQLEAQEKFTEAIAQRRILVAARVGTLGQDHTRVASSRCRLARTLLQAGRSSEALELAEQAWVRHQKEDTSARRRAKTAFVLARTLWAIEGPDGDLVRAKTLARGAAAAYEAAGEASADDLHEVQQWLAGLPAG